MVMTNYFIRCVVFHDIPLKGNCIVSIVDTYFRWVTIRYILIRGGYIVDTLKFSGTLFKGRGIHHLKGIHYKRILWNIRLFAD